MTNNDQSSPFSSEFEAEILRWLRNCAPGDRTYFFGSVREFQLTVAAGIVVRGMLGELSGTNENIRQISLSGVLAAWTTGSERDSYAAATTHLKSWSTEHVRVFLAHMPVFRALAASYADRRVDERLLGRAINPPPCG